MDSARRPTVFEILSCQKRQMLSCYKSQVSQAPLFTCYYCEKEGNKFETKIETEYLKHGVKRHYQKPIFPNTTDIEVYGLKPQGREWEV